MGLLFLLLLPGGTAIITLQTRVEEVDRPYARIPYSVTCRQCQTLLTVVLLRPCNVFLYFSASNSGIVSRLQ